MISRTWHSNRSSVLARGWCRRLGADVHRPRPARPCSRPGCRDGRAPAVCRASRSRNSRAGHPTSISHSQPSPRSAASRTAPNKIGSHSGGLRRRHEHVCASWHVLPIPQATAGIRLAQHLMPLWDLSAAQAGLMASAYAFGYTLAVPVLTTLTDRIDARRVLMVGSASSGIATALFGMIADGLWSATLIWGLAGIGFAGAYMPGLKALADRL